MHRTRVHAAHFISHCRAAANVVKPLEEKQEAGGLKQVCRCYAQVKVSAVCTQTMGFVRALAVRFA